MRTEVLMALAVKLVMTFIVGVVAFSFIDGNPWGQVFWVALVATAVNYFVGDRMVLPSYGNATAAVGDGIMGSIVAYLGAVITEAFTVSAASIVTFLVLVAIGEYFFHRYLVTADAGYRPRGETTG